MYKKKSLFKSTTVRNSWFQKAKLFICIRISISHYAYLEWIEGKMFLEEAARIIKILSNLPKPEKNKVNQSALTYVGMLF